MHCSADAERLAAAGFGLVAVRSEAMSWAAQSPWLTPAEGEQLSRLSSSARRREWICGRVTAKRLIVATICPDASPRLLEIESVDAFRRRIRPRVYLGGVLQPWSLSIAHSDGVVAAAVSTDTAVRVGVDVTQANGAWRGLAELWLTPLEKAWLEQQPGPLRRELVYELWAVKEAYFKASSCGGAFMPQQICVSPNSTGRYSPTSWTAPLRGVVDVSTRRVRHEVVAYVLITLNGESGTHSL